MKISIPCLTFLAFILGITTSCSSLLDGPEDLEGKHTVQFAEPGILRRYESFYVAPVVMTEADQQRVYAPTDGDLLKLGETFRDEVIKSLGSKYTQLNHPTRNVAQIYITVSNVWSDAALLSLRPGVLLPNTFRGGATMEARFVDSVTRKEIGVVYDSRRGTRQGFMSGLGKWDGAKRAFQEWAGMLAQATRG